MRDLRALLADAIRQLTGQVDQPRLDAEVLLAHALGRDRSWLYAWPEHVPARPEIETFNDLVARRRLGHPVAYLTGRREFWSMSLQVNADTLIPRPETEQLVEIALALELPGDARVLDLGTGSGAIALALARERPHWSVLGLDRSQATLRVARDNATRLGLERVQWLVGDWFTALRPGALFDLIVANPPYVAQGDPHLAQGDLRFEPADALVSGADGLDAVRRIVADAPGHLRPGGWLWLEHGHDQGAAVTALLSVRGLEGIALRADLAGQERHSGGRRPDGG